MQGPRLSHHAPRIAKRLLFYTLPRIYPGGRIVMTQDQLSSLSAGDTILEYYNGKPYRVFTVILTNMNVSAKGTYSEQKCVHLLTDDGITSRTHTGLLDDCMQVEIKRKKFIDDGEEIL